MSHIFLSYAREDRDKAISVRQAFKALKYKVSSHQFGNLSGWDRDENHAEFRKIVSTIEKIKRIAIGKLILLAVSLLAIVVALILSIYALLSVSSIKDRLPDQFAIKSGIADESAVKWKYVNDNLIVAAVNTRTTFKGKPVYIAQVVDGNETPVADMMVSHTAPPQDRYAEGFQIFVSVPQGIAFPNLEKIQDENEKRYRKERFVAELNWRIAWIAIAPSD
jgi:hypothetical protein